MSASNQLSKNVRRSHLFQKVLEQMDDDINFLKNWPQP